jgi:hypothetical protein
MLEQRAELCAEALDLVGAQCETRQLRDVRDVDLAG